mmetsp:Transcript_30741/g.47146  ORF Transcript_30741/g.47146 Transcript_30741/m.47146 type:complete len:90 (+) Transcript_30741:1637-1906(+)
MSPVQSRFFDSPRFHNHDADPPLKPKETPFKKRSISQKNLDLVSPDFGLKDLKKRSLELIEEEAELNMTQPPKIPARNSPFDNYCIRES